MMPAESDWLTTAMNRADIVCEAAAAIYGGGAAAGSLPSRKRLQNALPRDGALGWHGIEKRPAGRSDPQFLASFRRFALSLSAPTGWYDGCSPEVGWMERGKSSS
jgi:hypothetical protein